MKPLSAMSDKEAIKNARSHVEAYHGVPDTTYPGYAVLKSPHNLCEQCDANQRDLADRLERAKKFISRLEGWPLPEVLANERDDALGKLSVANQKRGEYYSRAMQAEEERDALRAEVNRLRAATRYQV